MKYLIIGIMFISPNVFAAAGCYQVLYRCAESEIQIFCVGQEGQIDNKPTFQETGSIDTGNGLVIENETMIVAIKNQSAQCTVNSENYEILVKPEVESGNLLGHCGAWLSATVSILKGGSTLASEYLGGSCYTMQSDSKNENGKTGFSYKITASQ